MFWLLQNSTFSGEFVTPTLKTSFGLHKLLIFWDFIQILILSTSFFVRASSISVRNNPRSGSRAVTCEQTDGEKDIHDEVSGRFSQLRRSPLIYWQECGRRRSLLNWRLCCGISAKWLRKTTKTPIQGCQSAGGDTHCGYNTGFPLSGVFSTLSCVFSNFSLSVLRSNQFFE